MSNKFSIATPEFAQFKLNQNEQIIYIVTSALFFNRKENLSLYTDLLKPLGYKRTELHFIELALKASELVTINDGAIGGDVEVALSPIGYDILTNFGSYYEYLNHTKEENELNKTQNKHTRILTELEIKEKTFYHKCFLGIPIYKLSFWFGILLSLASIIISIIALQE